jgi:hypothetical protein
VGLEARPPLLDRELVEQALRLPPEAHFQRSFNRPIVRGAMRLGGVPDRVRHDRTKSDLGGFYFRLMSAVEFPFVRDLLADRDACLREYVPAETLRELVESPPPTSMGGNRGWAVRVWNLAVVETFLRRLRDPQYIAGALESAALSRASARLHREVHAPAGAARTAPVRVG